MHTRDEMSAPVVGIEGTPKPVSKIGLGTWQFGSREWGYGDDYARREAHNLVRRALDLGVTLFDTAEIYAWGASGSLAGRSARDATRRSWPPSSSLSRRSRAWCDAMGAPLRGGSG
jgi:aryl-alcohol dehydrogenase-like predicted oxidoreductase